MNRRAAREIRRGILTARQVARRERVAPTIRPRYTPTLGYSPGYGLRLWEQAYGRELTRLVRTGVIQPPQSRS